MAFAIAAESYLFARPIFTGSQGALTVTFARRQASARSNLTHLNRNYYYFVLFPACGDLGDGPGISAAPASAARSSAVRGERTRGVGAHRVTDDAPS